MIIKPAKLAIISQLILVIRLFQMESKIESQLLQWLELILISIPHRHFVFVI